jgi:hypothetical protein
MVNHQSFDIFKMRAKLKSIWVRKLIGKLGVPYNRRLRVRGSCIHMINLLGIAALSRDLFIGITVSTKLAPRRNTRHG